MMLMPVTAISQAPNIPASAQTFTFPYQYGTPVVPKDVGAQGVQGPTVPLSQIGPQGNIGPSGHMGPVNISSLATFPKISSILSIHVFNGTANPSSAVNSVGSTVSLENVSNGLTLSETTSSHGYANFSTYEGWYVLQITQATSSWINFTQQLHIITSSLSVNRYLMPVANSTVSISNGPTAVDTASVYINAYVGWWTGSIPQMTVRLKNYSATGNPIIASVVTASNGTASFTNVNPSFSYDYIIEGNQSATAVDYGMATSLNTTFSISAGSNHVQYNFMNIAGINSGATITGTSMPLGTTGDWAISANTTIKGGSIILGVPISGPAYHVYLNFTNTILYIDGPDSGRTPSTAFDMTINFVNSSVIFLTQSPYFIGYTNVSFVHSAIIGSSIGSSFGRNTFSIENGYAFASIFTGGIDAAYQSEGWGGTYVNSVFKDGNFSLTSLSPPPDFIKGQSVAIFSHSEICNSSLEAGYEIYLNNSVVIGSPVRASNTSGTVSMSNTSMMISSDTPYIPSGGTSAYLTRGINDKFSYVYPTGLSLAAYDTDASDILLSITGGLSHNISYSCFNFTQTPRRTVTINGGNLTLFEDVVNANYTIPQEISLSANATTNLAFSSVLKFDISKNLNASYTTFNGTGNILLWSEEGNATYKHDLWENYLVGNAYAIFSMYSGVPTGYLMHVSFFNDTFQNVIYNATVFHNFETKLYGPIGTNWLYDTNFNGQSKPLGIFVMNYTTFKAFPIGPYNLFASGDVLLGANGVTAYISHDKFLNSPTYVAAPQTYANGTAYLAPFGADINIGAGSNYITDSYFLNLTNGLLPIQGIEITQGSGWKPYISLTNNYYFYANIAPYGNVDPNGWSLKNQTLSTPTDHWLTTNPLISTMGYEMPLDTNGTIVAAGQMDQYVYNSTLQQHNAVYTGASGNGITLDAWAWVIAPDVNTLSGTPTISYQNGLVGGPQPNFLWKGYDYSESVEPTYIQIGVNSSKAPAVNLEFNNLMKATAYIVYVYDNGTLWKDWAFNSNSSTNYTVVYNPANMPLDPTILVTPWTAPPPSPPPTKGPISVISLGQSMWYYLEQPYVFIPLAIVAVAAMVLISGNKKGRRY